MPEILADLHCPDCGGSGIAPGAEPTYHDGAPGIPDPAGWEPCDCIVRQWAATPQPEDRRDD